MSNPQQKPWSDNPNAPKIPYHPYVQEKANFAGVLMAAILYGIVIVMFFQCMAGLLSPLHYRRDGVKWGVISYTLAIFSSVTVSTAMTLNIESISYIDNRNFPGVEGILPPGPYGFRTSIYSDALSIPPNVMFFLNNWLADGFLLHRCYIIYARNLSVIAFPFLVYLSSVGMGILVLYETSQPASATWAILLLRYSIPWISVAVSLNAILTLMIVLRLFLGSRNVRAVTGSPSQISGLYVAVATMFIESCALYTVNSLVLLGLWVTNSDVAGAFIIILSEIQSIAPLLIIKRIADRSALTSDTFVSGHISQFRSKSRGGSTDGSTSLGRYPMNSLDKYRTSSSEAVAGVGAVVDLRPDSQV